MSCHKKTAGWTAGANCGAAGTISWSSSSGGAPFDSASSGSVIVSNAKYYSFSLSPSMVQGWINDSSTNYGILIKSNDETVVSYIACYFADETTVSRRPKLTIYYTL